jgi:hypothetical protein
MRHLSYANVMATIAVFVALGGSSYAALKVTGRDVQDGSLTGRDVRDGSLTGRDVRDGSLTGRDVRDGSLTGRDIKDRSVSARDLAPGVIRQGPAGPQGPQGAKGDQGPTGERGPRGETGTVDTSNIYDKAQADARFLRVEGKAADAALLDGTPKSGFVGTSDGFAALPDKGPSADGCTEAAHVGRIASDDSGAWRCTSDGWQTLTYPHVRLETVQLGADVGIHVDVSGFAPSTSVTYAYTHPGGSGSGNLGITDASGKLDATMPVNSCGASGRVHDWRILVGGRVAAIARRAYPTC